ncbi:MAG: hypothetical protein KF866_09690 [Phycisphaeraceae bacterium]|nr:hypothetical protein [Phycisphaeraceae bacterium]MCW5754771.1 hypothetical protein [Phycisphaeraceae bacterium]
MSMLTVWAVLAYRPFLDPLDAHRFWWALLLPLALFTAMAYKAVRVPVLDRYWRQVGIMSLQIVIGMVALGFAFYLFTQIILPRVLPMPGL